MPHAPKLRAYRFQLERKNGALGTVQFAAGGDKKALRYIEKEFPHAPILAAWRGRRQFLSSPLWLEHPRG